MMDKFSGRFYVSTLIVVAAMDAANKAINGPWYIWFFVIIHLTCLFIVIKDGVQ